MVSINIITIVWESEYENIVRPSTTIPGKLTLATLKETLLALWYQQSASFNMEPNDAATISNEIAILKADIERLNDELKTATAEKIQSAQYGLVLLVC